MTLLFPLGLLGLIGIPIIIIIYILQSRYTEQTVNSTYIWTLSEKFMKRKNPLSGITGIISLILQLLMVTLISLAIAHPIITIPNSAHNYCFVLDASGSMNMVEGKETRFELAQDEIIEVIKDSRSGSSYSLVCVAKDTVTLFDGITDKKSAIELVEKAEVKHTEATKEGLLGVAQRVFDNNSSTKIYLVTDKKYEEYKNVEVIEIGSSDRENYGVFDATYTHFSGKVTATASAISYASDATLEIALKVNGEEKTVKSVSVKKGESTEFSIEASAESVSNIEITIKNSDGYDLDNSTVVHNIKGDQAYSILIVSESGFFLEAIIDAVINSKVDVVTPKEYEDVTDKYGLYIFDSFEPTTLPNGNVWLINIDESIENLGFGIRGKIPVPNPQPLEKTTNTATAVRELLRGVEGNDIYITNYIKYSKPYSESYTLFTYDSNPVIFAGLNGLGNRQAVFAFDIHESNIALTTDFVMLIRNLLEYSFPNVVNESSYTVGEEAIINIIKSGKNFKAQSPSGKDIFVETETASTAIALDEVGTYKISLIMEGNIEPTVYCIYAGASKAESVPQEREGEFLVDGEKTEANIDGTFDPTTLFFILMAIIFIADWGVYCYEKYQLR